MLVAAPGWHRVLIREQLQDMPVPSPEATRQPGAAGATDLMIETGPFDFDNGVVAWQVRWRAFRRRRRSWRRLTPQTRNQWMLNSASTTVEAGPLATVETRTLEWWC